MSDLKIGLSYTECTINSKSSTQLLHRFLSYKAKVLGNTSSEWT